MIDSLYKELPHTREGEGQGSCSPGTAKLVYLLTTQCSLSQSCSQQLVHGGTPHQLHHHHHRAPLLHVLYLQHQLVDEHAAEGIFHVTIHTGQNPPAPLPLLSRITLSATQR
jgi:hypothetical protein